MGVRGGISQFVWRAAGWPRLAYVPAPCVAWEQANAEASARPRRCHQDRIYQRDLAAGLGLEPRT